MPQMSHFLFRSLNFIFHYSGLNLGFGSQHLLKFLRILKSVLAFPYLVSNDLWKSKYLWTSTLLQNLIHVGNHIPPWHGNHLHTKISGNMTDSYSIYRKPNMRISHSWRSNAIPYQTKPGHHYPPRRLDSKNTCSIS